MLTGYDLDGTLTAPPPTGSVVISGRTFAEYDDLAKRIAAVVPVYIRGVGAFGDRQAAGEFKAQMITHLGVTVFYDDDDLQAEIIRQRCPNVEVRRP